LLLRSFYEWGSAFLRFNHELGLVVAAIAKVDRERHAEGLHPLYHRRVTFTNDGELALVVAVKLLR
jgi:hypothetical protein